jgi:PAS domain S-box-containing protein
MEAGAHMGISRIGAHGEPERPCASGQQSGARSRDNPARLQRILDSIKDYAIITLDRDGCIASWNRGAERLLGYAEDEVLGRSGDIFFTPEDRKSGAPERERRLANQEGRAVNERWHVRKDGSRFWGSGLMLPVSDGDSDAYLKIFRDNTEARRAAERQALLIDELNHRVKNTLAIVQSMAMQTLRSCPSTADARDALESRLVSLAKAHDILTSGQWRGGDLCELVTGALEAYSGDSRVPRFDIHGPPVRLRPKALLALSMAVHELGTNAMKYGALSNESGRVEISWDLGETVPQRFRFHWKESGGPPVEPPRKRGFGSRLVEEGLGQDIAAEVHLNFAVEGLECTIEAPAKEITESEG